jgi:hypothetical protein
LPPSPLVAVSVVDRGVKSLPPDCAVPHSLATRAEAIVRTATHLDPNGVVGTNTATAYYAPGIGLVCNVASSASGIYATLDPAAPLAASEIYHTTTSLTRLVRAKASSQAPALADVVPYAAGVALSDTTRRRTRATMRAAMRPYLKR